MYNVNFLPQIEEFRANLFGTAFDLRQASDEAHSRYSLPKDVKVLECHKDTNGEWVPVVED